MPLFDQSLLVRLRGEFRLSMKRLLGDLCLDLENQYADVATSLTLPVPYFRYLGRSLGRDAYAHWKVVGWIEALNDLVYFIDLLQQIREEQDVPEFAAQLFAECQEKFFENSYLDDLFPRGSAQASGLERRLNQLCKRLTQELTQESLCLVPGLPMLWCEAHKIPSWSVAIQLGGNVERVETVGTMAMGLGGDSYEAPSSVKRGLKQSAGLATLLVRSNKLSVKIGRTLTPLCTMRGHRLDWSWQRRPSAVAIETEAGPITVGQTLVYKEDRQPKTVAATSTTQVTRINRAWTTIQEAWPEGHGVLSLLTTRIVPLKAKGVVSFSYRHSPGLSFINCFDRGNLDLVDDLTHENSHHHLNLLLRKYVMYQGDRNQQVFYSPWRRSLRPFRGILQGAFTFTMGAMLFERLSTWASGVGGAARWKRAGLTEKDLQRARFRCLEEVESVRYSIHDLEYASWHLKWLTGSGKQLVKQLTATVEEVEQSIGLHRKAVLASKFGPALRKHMKELQQARELYGPGRLSRA